MYRVLQTFRLAALLLIPLYCGDALSQQSDTVTTEQLQKALKERDAVIIDLLHRVRELEEKLGANGDRTGPSATQPPPANTGVETNSPSESGALVVDELAAERALERSLVQQGSRLLWPGQVEIAPGFAFSRFESGFPTVVVKNSDSFVGEVRRTTDLFDANIGIRMGLPYNTQLEVNAPYRFVNQDSAANIDGVAQATNGRHGSGLGDISVGLAAHLIEEKSWRPNLVGRVVWLTGTGEEAADGVALGGKDQGIGTRFSAYWRRDPAVFLIGAGYTHYYDGGDLRPGNSFDFSLGTALAISPETALTFSLDQSYVGDYKLNGEKLPGTDHLSSVFDVSAATILGRGLFLQINAGVGLTSDAPDYRFGISLPFRFDLR